MVRVGRKQVSKRTSWRIFIQTGKPGAEAYQTDVQLNIVKHVGGKIKVFFFLNKTWVFNECMSVDSVWEPILDIFSHHIFIWRTEPIFHSDCRDWKHTHIFLRHVFSQWSVLFVYFLLVLQPLSLACFHSAFSLKGYGQSATWSHPTCNSEGLIKTTERASPDVHLRLVCLFLWLNRMEGAEGASPLIPFTSSSIHSVCVATAHLWVVFGQCLLILQPPLSPNPLPH